MARVTDADRERACKIECGNMFEELLGTPCPFRKHQRFCGREATGAKNRADERERFREEVAKAIEAHGEDSFAGIAAMVRSLKTPPSGEGGVS